MFRVRVHGSGSRFGVQGFQVQGERGTPNLEPRTLNWNAEHEPGTGNVELGTSVQEERLSKFPESIFVALPACGDVLCRRAGFDLTAQLFRSSKDVDRHLVVLVLVRRLPPCESSRID